LSGAVAIFDRNPVTGVLTQGPGLPCVSETGSGGTCVDGVALSGPTALVMSPDGRNVYVGTNGSQAVAVFDRDLATGALTQKEETEACIGNSVLDATCAEGRGLYHVFDLAISPDGRSVYVISFLGMIAVLDRDPVSGALTQKPGTEGCLVSGDDTQGCAVVPGLAWAQGLAMGPEGATVYVAGDSAIHIFDRDEATGALAPRSGVAGCVSETGSSGACTDGFGLQGAFAVSLSPDGRSLYAATLDGAVVVFDRDPATGAVTQKAGRLGCISDDGTGGACTDGNALDGAVDLTVSPDGGSVYVAAQFSYAVAVLDRDPRTGQLRQKPGTAGCIDDRSGDACLPGTALTGPTSIAVSADGRNVYMTSVLSDSISVFARDLSVYDLDGDGQVEPLTDGVMLLRYTFGFRGAVLIDSAVNFLHCRRCTAEEIATYVESVFGN
jgi:DNA-binding beta-propeller fold protein YncE